MTQTPVRGSQMNPVWICLVFLVTIFVAQEYDCQNHGVVLAQKMKLSIPINPNFTYDEGGIVRASQSKKTMAIAFTGDLFAEAAETILDGLKLFQIPGNFFVTGNFLNNSDFSWIVKRILAENHYLGPHSNTHPLYCEWGNRNNTLVNETFFVSDLTEVLDLLTAASGGTRTRADMHWWIPPYEYWNDVIAQWSYAQGMTLFDGSPGTFSEADYAPDNDHNFLPSIEIYDSIISYPQQDPNGFNGFILLMHLGAGPNRTDLFYPYIPSVFEFLVQSGYEILKVSDLIG